MITGQKTSISGGDLGVLFQDRRDFYLDPQTTHELYAAVAPFLTFITRQPARKKSKDPDYKMFEHRGKWYDINWEITGTYTTTSFLANDVGDAISALDIDDSTISGGISEGMVVEIYNQADEYVGNAIVTAFTADTVTLRVTHKSTESLTGSSNLEMCYVITNNQAEGVGSPTAWSDELEVAYNSAGIMKTPVEITGTLLEMALRGYSKELARLRSEKDKEHKILRNKNFLFSRRIGGIYNAPDHLNDTNGKPIRMTHGIIPSIEDYDSGANVHNMSLSSVGWNEFLRIGKEIFRHTNEFGMKYMFTGDEGLMFFNTIGADGFLGDANINIGPAQKKYGFNFRDFEMPYGIIRLVREPLLTLTHGGKYSGYGIVVDPESVNHVTYRKSKYQTAIQANDIDGIKDQYFSDEGLGITLAERNHLLKLTVDTF